MNDEFYNGCIIHRVTSDKLRDLISRAYELSQPQGLGHLQYHGGELPEKELDRLLDVAHHAGWRNVTGRGIHLDYVLGRSVKLSIKCDDEGYFLVDRDKWWYDHSEAQFEELLKVL